MFCRNCGTQLPDTAKFCLNCGQPQTAQPTPLESTRSPELWETCEIVTDYEGDETMFSTRLCRFWAKAVAPEGSYFVACSDSFKVPQQTPQQVPSHIQALEHLTTALTQTGWLSLTRGEHWYSLRFRRHIGAPGGRHPDDGKRFDVILEQTDKRRTIAVRIRIREESQLSPGEVERIVKHLPVIVVSRVPRLKAEGIRLRLETEYCRVLVRPSA